MFRLFFSISLTSSIVEETLTKSSDEDCKRRHSGNVSLRTSTIANKETINLLLFIADNNIEALLEDGRSDHLEITVTLQQSKI